MKRYLLLLLLPLGYACSLNNIREDAGLEKYFQETRAEGCFGLFDNGTGEFTIFNTPRFRDSTYLPASTFKVISSLVAIETGIAKDSAFVIPWDSIPRAAAEWNQALTLQEAFRHSAVPAYQQLVRRLGKDTLQHWLDTLGYGSLHTRFVIPDRVDTFWLDNSLKVTADEQLGLMKKLYFGQLPFQPRSQRIVRHMMRMEDNANYTLSYKTGTGTTDDRHTLSWITGWIEENRHPYFFVLQLEWASPPADPSAIRLELLKKILKEYGFMEGKR